MPVRRFMQLFTPLAIVALAGCDLRYASFDYPVRSGTLRVRQSGDVIAFTFADQLGHVIAQEKQTLPYVTTYKECYVIVDADENVLLLKSGSIINRLPKDKTDENALVQDVLEQVTTVAFSRAKSEFVNLQVNRLRWTLQEDVKKQILSSVERIDIHEPVDANVVAALRSFPSLATVIIGNQRIEGDAFDVQHFPKSVRKLNIAHCRRISYPDALISELNASGITDLLINKDQENSLGGKLHLNVNVISPD